jgi:hypothetical protein
VIRSGEVSGLVLSRSTACPADCAAAACTLGQVAAARRVRGRHRDIGLWAELTVAAHLAGWPSPELPDTVREQLAGLDPRLRDCAIGGAVEEAVAARVPGFAARVSGPALADHAAEALRGALAGTAWPCSGEEARWHAPARAGTGFRKAPPLRDAVLGTRSPGVLEEAAGTWAGDPDFAGLLAGALSGFEDGETYADGIAGVAAGAER